MKTKKVPINFEHTSPAGAEVRLLLNNRLGGLAHCTLEKGTTSKPVTHKTVNEFWHVISGTGEIWRSDGENELITKLEPGVSIDIPLGTNFQYRSFDSDLAFICVTMPPWPGADEVDYIDKGAWTPTYKETA